ncbi:16S rRNA (guanine(527)-N(7))-methyltransferase RsmG [Sulfobacillus thermosulfidooxidans]|uniref:16S rRNA (guanine(527)-N(7))-methyltransferase RsmG n=1 Tax=Sulfobacillus thermosulfidooxidans TaxID=28034 RepID=UPI0006B45135|nr:16S rRNA (guanine(527)-N(7))-methyltransferase RsmG [Sulfobacillus thermosulfidooxidans]
MIEKPSWLNGDLVGRLDEHGIQERLEALITLIREAPFNITGFRTPEELWVHGVFDALQTVQGVSLSEIHTAVDIGSGGGFPGLVLAILMNSTTWYLIEARQKRAEYLGHMVEVLNLSNTQIINERAEDFIRHYEDFRERADIVTARAVGSLRITLELSLPFLKIGGSGLFPKGRAHALAEVDEARALCQKLGGSIEAISEPYGDNGSSQVVRVAKVRTTPPQFPRRAKWLGMDITKE